MRKLESDGAHTQAHCSAGITLEGQGSCGSEREGGLPLHAAHSLVLCAGWMPAQNIGKGEMGKMWYPNIFKCVISLVLVNAPNDLADLVASIISKQ